MFRISFTATVAAVLCSLLAAPVQAAISRTYVASTGSDTNATFSCDFAHPCRTLQAAFSQVTDGGEILALDGSGYGPITIDRSVSIVANPGAFAGIGVFGGGTGVTIATAGVSVVLRGLTINGQGGNYGIAMSNGARLSIENCVFANFSSAGQAAVYVSAPATVRIVDSLFRDNNLGAEFIGGATASISASRFFGNVTAVYVTDTASTTTTAFIDRSVANGNGFGFIAQSTAGGTTRLFVTESVVTNNSSRGMEAYAVPGTSEASVSNSLIAGNNVGVYAYGSGVRLIASGNTVSNNAYGLNQASSAVLESAGDNTVRNNTSADTVGTITPFSRM